MHTAVLSIFGASASSLSTWPTFPTHSPLNKILMGAFLVTELRAIRWDRAITDAKTVSDKAESDQKAIHSAFCQLFSSCERSQLQQQRLSESTL